MLKTDKLHIDHEREKASAHCVVKGAILFCGDDKTRLPIGVHSEHDVAWHAEKDDS